MASALKTHTLGAGQFVEFTLIREWNEAMKMMRTEEIQILNEYMIVVVVICNLGNCTLTRKKNQNSTVAITIFWIVCCEAVARGLDNV